MLNPVISQCILSAKGCLLGLLWYSERAIGTAIGTATGTATGAAVSVALGVLAN